MQTIRVQRPLATELVLAAMRLIGIGLIAVGISGVLAWCFGVAAGKAFVAGNPPGATYTASRCREFFEDVPHARSCSAAATSHHFDEVVWYRVAAGVLGGAVLLAFTLIRRRRGHFELRPEMFVPTVGATVFGLAGIWLIGQGIDTIALKADGGGGGYLSGGIVALAFATWLAVPAIKSLAVRVAPPAAASVASGAPPRRGASKAACIAPDGPS